MFDSPTAKRSAATSHACPVQRILFILGLTDSNQVVLQFKAVLVFGVISYKLKMGVRIILNGMTICQLRLQMIHHFQYSIVKS